MCIRDSVKTSKRETREEIIRKSLADALTYLEEKNGEDLTCLLYTSPSPRDRTRSRMPSSA